MKSTYILSFSIIAFFFTMVAFSQDLTDQEIGFDAARITFSLNERGITDFEFVNSEIEKMRKTYTLQYIEMKKNESELLKKSNSIGLLNTRGSGIADVSQTEKEALQTIYNNMGGAGWTSKTGWDFSTPVTSWDANTKTGWYGIIVNNNQIVSLNLVNNNLNGQIPEQIRLLKNLQSLYLQNNVISGVIPSSIEELTSLTVLNLQNNKLRGSIPEEISGLSNIRNLLLSSNTLAGNIPLGICNLKNLSILYLDYNELTGSIPSQIGNLSLLKYFDLGYNKINGTIPSEFYNLISLERFYLEYNSVIGPLSPEINKLVNLQDFRVLSNQLIGEIPAAIGQLSKLQTLDLRTNQLTGIIPPEVGNLQELGSLILYGNKFTGEIPVEIAGLKKLKILWLHDNQLRGSVPGEFVNLSNLEMLYLRNNQLQGLLPDFSNLTSLSSLDIRSNKFRFIDFVSQFSLYAVKMGNNFNYSPQYKIDTAKTITEGVGSSITLNMFEDDRFISGDTFQWYKNNTLITGANSRQYTLINVKITDAGTYSCRSSHTSNPNMSPLILEREPIILNVVDCKPVIGVIKNIN